MKKNVLLFLLFIFVCTTPAAAQIENGKYVIGKQLTIHSEILDQDRKLIVHLPIGYDVTSTEYPVLYLLDGGYHFHHTTGITQFLSGLGKMPQTIVVAIQNIDRNKDFLPTHIENPPTSGGGKTFLEFIQTELLPYIDENYRTAPYRILVGHSFGGTFAMYAFLEKSALFNAYIAISPYLHWDNDFLLTKAETALLKKYDNNTFFYMTLGDEPPYIPTIDKFVALIDSTSPENLDFSFTHMIEENHGTAPHRSIYNGLETLFDGWGLTQETYVKGLEAINQHYQQLSETYGYTIMAPEATLNMLGYGYLAENDFEKAISVFQENVKRYPKSANVYDSLGEAYEKSEQLEMAKANYAEACALASEDDPNYTIFQDNLERVKELLK